MNERYMVNKTDNFRRITACLCVVIFVWLYVVITTRFIYSSLIVCCYNNEIKYAARVGVIFGFGVWVLYFIDTALLLVIHIPYTQKWALPFPCSKTKSEISFSLGWAQEGLRRTVALLRVCEWIQLWNLSAWVKFARGMFWFYILCAQRCW